MKISYFDIYKICSDDDFRPAMQCVKIAKFKENYVAVATDSFKLKIVSVELSDNEKEIVEKFNILIPSEIFKRIKKNTNTRKINLNDYEFKLGETSFIYKLFDYDLYAEYCKEEFPPFQSAIPKLNGNHITLALNPSFLKEISKEFDDPLVILKFEVDEKGICRKPILVNPQYDNTSRNIIMCARVNQ